MKKAATRLMPLLENFHWKYCSKSVLESIIVKGVSEVHFPLSPNDRAKLLSVCEQSPFGRGLDTVVDTTVRRVWQVDVSKVTLSEEFSSKTAADCKKGSASFRTGWSSAGA